MYRSSYPWASLFLAFALWAGSLWAGNIQYGYDTAGRLVKVDYGDGRVLTYAYDGAGNLLKREWTSTGAAPAAAKRLTARPALSFEANQGQVDRRFEYLARRASFQVAIGASEAQFALAGASVRLEWLGANAGATASGQEPLGAASNYLTGPDSREWRTGVPHFGRIRYAGIYPGVDVVYYGNPQQLEYDLLVGPGADPAAIRFRLHGASGLRLAPNGDLLFQAGAQATLFERPVLRQVVRGVSRPVRGDYEIRGETVGFRIGAYDRSLPLIIDPVFGDYTLAGGSGDDIPTAAVEDAQGFLYIVGTTTSLDMPNVQRAVQPTNAGATDIFVMKLSHDTKRLVWVTYLGGTGAETAGGIAVDRQGVITISGTTGSTNFPVTPDALQRSFAGGGTDGFVARLNAKGERLLYSTYLGGAAADAASTLAVDAAGVIVVAGVTASTNFATRPGAIQDKHNGGTDGFIVRLNPGDPQPIYATFLGGAAADAIQRVALDATGGAYVAGSTSSANFPTTTGALATANAGGIDGFVARLNPAGTALVYSTYVGGTADDQILGLALSGASAVVSGVTASRILPMRGNVLNGTYLGGPTDGFLLRLSPTGSEVTGGTYLGGSGADSADAIAVRAEGTLLVAVNGTSFPGEPARMYAFSGDLSRDFGTQTISTECMGSEGRIVALSHSLGRSLAIGWSRATGACQAPQWLAKDGKESRSKAPGERFSTGHAEMFVGASGPAPSAPPAALPAIRPASQYSRSTGSAGDPFSTATGEHTDSFDDLNLSGPLHLRFRRYYSSVLAANEIPSALGLNWSHNYDLALSVTGSTAVVFLEAGKKVTFRLTGGAWQIQAQQQSEYRLVESATDYRMADIARRLIVTFNRRGQLIRIEDRNGNALRVAPGASGPLEVADSLGRFLRFTYLGGFLTEVGDHGGRLLRFGYRGENLESFTNVYGRVTRYEYAQSGRLIRHVLPSGNAAYTNTYDQAGRVIEQADSDGQPTKVAYEAAGATAVTEPLNAVTRHVHDGNGDLVRVVDAAGSTTEMAYDAAHRRTSVKDALGNTTAIVYHPQTGLVQSSTDAVGGRTNVTFTPQGQGGFTFFNLTRVEYPDGATVAYEFDSRGNPVTITDRAGKIWKYTYNAQGLPLTITNPAGAVVKSTYNANGTLATVATPTGDTTTYDRDNLGRIISITSADGTARRFEYDAGDHLVRQTDELGKTMEYGFNQDEQRTSATDQLGVTEEWAYNAKRRPGQVTDRMGNKSTVSYNRNGMVTKLTDAAGGEVEFSYDALNRVSSVGDSLGTLTRYEYDRVGDLTGTSDGLGRAWKMETDKLGRLTKATSPLGATGTRVYDAAGRVTSIVNGAGEKTEYSYNRRGQVMAIQAPGGLKTSLTRDDAGAVASLTDAGGAVWKNGYDEAGRLVSKTDPLERKFEYKYDKQGRMAEIKLPGDLGSTTLGYDAAGRMISSRYSDGSQLTHKRDAKGRVVEASGLTLAYDANDRLIDANGIATQRDALGRVAAITYAPGKTVRYSYNVRSQVTKITDWLGGETVFAYDNAGAVTAIARPNAVVTSFAYDGDGRLSSIAEKKDETLSQHRFQYDSADRVVAEERSTPPPSKPAPTAAAFTYDAASQQNGATYDAAGRLVAGSGRTVTWNGASRPTAFTSGESAVTLDYDARGQLISRTAGGETVNYVVNYGMARPVTAAERKGGVDTRYHVHLPNGKLLYSVDAASEARRFYHFDRLGSTTLLTADDGSVTDAYEITPYGEITGRQGNTANPFTFLGAWGAMQQDEAGLYLLRFRLYDATAARFLSRDPVLDPAPRAVNPYQYALGNPIKYTDAAGLSATQDENGGWGFFGALLKAMLDTPEGRQMLREAQAEEARLKAEEEERERQRVREETARIEREALEAQQRFLIRYAQARAMEIALWSATFQTNWFTCDLDLNCVNWTILSESQKKAKSEIDLAQFDLAGKIQGGVLMANLSARLIGMDGSTLIGLDGSTLIGNDGSTLIGNDGSTLIGMDGSTLIGNDGSTLIGIGVDPSLLIGNDGST